MPSGIRSAVSVAIVARLVIVKGLLLGGLLCHRTQAVASLLRKPFSALTSLAQPPRPGTPGFALWKRFTGLNSTVFRLSGGRLLGTYDGNPVLLLHHVGRKSCEERVTPLIYVEDGEDLVIVGSMGGTPKHPAWFHNLTADPDTQVELRGGRRDVR